MAKRSYSEVVQGKPSVVNWLAEYQVEDEDVAMGKALRLSQVSFV